MGTPSHILPAPPESREPSPHPPHVTWGSAPPLRDTLLNGRSARLLCQLRTTASSHPPHTLLNALSTPPRPYQHVHRPVNDLSTARGKTWEGLPKTSPGGLATTWPGGCPVVQCQSRGAGCRCTGVQWSRSAQVLMRTRAHLTFRFYFHPRTAIFRLQNATCLRQTCPLRFKNAIWRGPRRVPSQGSIFRVPSQGPN